MPRQAGRKSLLFAGHWDCLGNPESLKEFCLSDCKSSFLSIIAPGAGLDSYCGRGYYLVYAAFVASTCQEQPPIHDPQHC